MKIYGCMNLYGHNKELQQTLPALRRVADEVIIIEGPYRDFLYREKMTEDDFLFIHSLSDKIISKPEWDSQIEKRNTYLKLVPEGSYALIVDADEEIIGNLPELTEKAYRVSLYEKGVLKNNILRLVKKTKNLECHSCHNYFWDGEILLNQQEWPVVENLVLKHIPISRKRRKFKEMYYKGLIKNEESSRKKYGI